MSSVDRINGLTGDLAIKTPVRVATTANITLSGLQTIDGVSLAAGDRVLVKNQTDAVDNGIWTASTSSWSRALDFDGSYDCVQGTLVSVTSGTVNEQTVWQLTTANPVIGTSSLTFERGAFSDAANMAADDGASGSLWETVQGFINKLIGLTGASHIGGAGRVVGSIAALRTLDKTLPSKHALVTGYYAQGDGVGGAYWYDSADTTSADNGGTVIVANDGGRWKRVTEFTPSSSSEFGGVGDGVADDTTAISNATAAKRQNTVIYDIPIGTFPITLQQSLTGYFHLRGHGDQSQIKVSGGATALAYTSHAGVFDDHPHNLLRDFRITGDGAMAVYPAAQNGTTKGQTFATVDNIGSFGSAQGMVFELHDVGRHIKKSYVHNGGWNHFRGNKIGLRLEEITSYTETGSYFRGHSTAAVDIIGGQNVTLRGGAIEGNAGVGIRYTAGSSSWGQLNIEDVYLESNGSESGGIWSIDVPFGSPTMVNVKGGNLWRNVASGVTSGPYRLGDNATLDGATLNGAIYAKYLRVLNTRGNPTWGTFATEATARLFGLGEPPIMLEYSPAVQEYDFSAATGGIVFGVTVAGKGVAKLPGITNLMSATYPYGFSASSGATGAANAGLNYGEGDAFRVTYAASTGNFSSNYATLVNFTDTAKPYRVCCVVVYPEADCELGFIQSVGGQSINANYALKANTYYKLVMCGMAPMSAGSFLRVFPLNSAAPVVNFIGTWASAHTTHAEQLRVMRALVSGRI